LGTANLLSAILNVDSVRSCIIVTTDKCYQNNEWDWPYRENDRLGGFDPYSNSKAVAELITDSYYKSFFQSKKTIGLATVRAGNVIGGGDFSENRIIPDIVRAIYGDKSLEIRRPFSVRPWQHVYEPLNGYIMLAKYLHSEPLKYSGPWNFGPEIRDSIAVKDIIDLCQKYSRKYLEYKIVKSENHEAGLLRLDSSKAKLSLKWEPILSCDEMIEQTMLWYSSFYNNSDVLELSKKLILSYINSVSKNYDGKERI
jgi:CDP-glucose 4,6-dehydratase